MIHLTGCPRFNQLRNAPSNIMPLLSSPAGLVPNTISSTALDVTGRTVELLNTFGDVTPIVPLKTICGVALIIINTVKQLRKLKDDNQNLATRTAELAIAIATECSANGHLSSEQKQKCDRLLEALEEIKTFMQLQRDVGRFKRYLKMTEFQDSIVAYNQKLDDCGRLFSITSIMEIQRLISSEAIINRSSLATLSLTINSNIEKVAKTMESGHKDVRSDLKDLASRFDLVLGSKDVSEVTNDDDGFRVLRPDQLILGRSLRTLSNAHIYRGKFTTEGGFTKSVVKSYNPTRQGREEFKDALKFWKKNFHPNLHRLLGHSTMSAPSPFLLFPDYASLDVPGYMLKQLDAGEVTSFVSTARLLHGVAVHSFLFPSK
ncbi:hypothetical protein CPB84DRAFT_655171 [Gymnopilus junonius]|uniref:Protein kinase domain-containing protein n=1 Tax=Gymnopilus junonius TaxID=109634 RepID=A0A9P5NUS8_GYMJU|nr:hypothetical protein CPB84DRAFT_655171 [Gymnopilus junonius]